MIGMFRDPLHAALERQKASQKNVKVEEETRAVGLNGGNQKDHQSLRHLKLTFPAYEEGNDSLEWLRDCEEYFAIYEVNDGKRAAIAAMHLSEIPRSWYKSFMIGRNGVSWHQFSEAFIGRFGETDTELVFDRFKRLQQKSSVEEYYDNFEKCRGQVLKKIPNLTDEYFLEILVGGLQSEIKGMIRLLEPTSLEHALKLARYYEQNLSTQPRKYSNMGSNQKSGTSASVTTKGSTTGRGTIGNNKARSQRLSVLSQDV